MVADIFLTEFIRLSYLYEWRLNLQLDMGGAKRARAAANEAWLVVGLYSNYSKVT